MLVGNCFGFVANRMLAYYMREALPALEEGASAQQMDKALTDFGMPMGPFAMQDMAGIDVGARIRQHLAPRARRAPKGRSRPCPTGCSRWAATARKPAPAGIVTRPGSRTPIPDPLIDELAQKAAAKRGIARRAGHRR